MRDLDYMIDLGHDYGTRLSAILGIVPPSHVTIDPPYPGDPTLYIHLKHNLGILPCYQDPEEVKEWFEENAPRFVYLGGYNFCDGREIVNVLPPEHMEIERAEGEEAPRCFVQMTSGLILPAYLPAPEIMEHVRRMAAGFFQDV